MVRIKLLRETTRIVKSTLGLESQVTGATAVAVVILSPHMSLCVDLAWEAHWARVTGENSLRLTLTGQHSLRPHTHGRVRCKLGGGGVSIFSLGGEGRCKRKDGRG